MNESQISGLAAALENYVSGFEVDQSLTPTGDVKIGLYHIFSISYRQIRDMSKFMQDVIKEVDKAILGTGTVATLMEEMKKKDAQIEALLKQNAEMQRYVSYVDVAKEIAKAAK